MYIYTLEQFRNFVNKEENTASYLVPLESPWTLLNCDEDGCNEFCCDNAVEGGYMLQDFSSRFEVNEGKVCIRVHVADASEWIQEYC